MSTKVQAAMAKFFARMLAAGVNLSQLSRASGITRVTLSNWKHAKSEPTLEKYLEADDALKELEADAAKGKGKR